MIIFNRDLPPGDAQALGLPGAFYVTDLHHRAFFCPARWDATHLRLEPSPDMPVAVHVLYAAPGFGPLWLTADNRGHGYSPGGPSYNLLAELATSQVARCHSRTGPARAAVAHLLDSLPASDGRGMTPPEARTLLGDALRVGEDVEHVLSLRRGRGSALLSGTFFGERRGPYAIGVGPDWPVGQTPDFLRPARMWPLIAAACQATTLPNFWRWIEEASDLSTHRCDRHR